MHRSCKEWYLVLAHILTFFDLQKYDIFLIQPNNNSKNSFFQPIGGVTADKSQIAILNELAQMTFGCGEAEILPHDSRVQGY
jgi:hypothetical protein